MIRKITLENFMSHGKTVIDLADGLTVLTGPNNCGKSALVAALQIIAANGKTTHVMRHGAKFCRITVETDDEHTIVWERKKTTVKYNINGEDVHRVGQSIPAELHDYLKLAKVSADSGATKNEYDIHFGEQKSPVFLLDESGSRAAAFFASSSDASRLVEMQHLHRSRVQSTRSKARRLSSEKESNATRLAAFSPIDAITESVKVAERLQAQCDEQRCRNLALSRLVDELRAAQLRVTRWRRQHQVLSQLDQTETTPDVLRRRSDICQRLAKLLRSRAMLAKTRDLEGRRSAVLSQLRPAPPPQPCERLETLMRRLRDTSLQRTRALRVQGCCEKLITPPEMLPTGPCRRSRSRLIDASETQRRTERIAASLAALTAPQTPLDTGGLHHLRERIRNAIAHRASIAEHLRITSQLRKPTESAANEPLRRMIAELRIRARRRAAMLRYCHAFEGLQSMGMPQDPKALTVMISRLRPAIEVARIAQRNAQQATIAVQSHERLIREFVSSHPKCETCGGSIDPETLMSTLPNLHQHGVRAESA